MKNILTRLGLISFLSLLNPLISCATMVSGKELAAEYYNLGNAYFALQRYREAIEFYERALQLDRTQAKISYNLACAYLAFKNYMKANQLLEGLLAKDPLNVDLLALQAYARHLEKKDDEAINLYLKILSIQPEDRNSFYNLGVIYWGRNNLANAEIWFKKLLEHYPTDAPGLLAYGLLLSKTERLAEAVDYFKQYLQLKPDDQKAYLALGQAYMSLKQYLKALDIYEKVLAINSNLKEAWFSQASILLTKAEDPERGYVSLEQALELGFKDQEALAELAQNVSASRLLDYEKNRVFTLLKKKGFNFSK